ncbi:NAD(P)/FAD-dependent oxidoreductase [Pseudonocardia adelaidensis]|uniref:NAD(P)/FAD-dependent oxidoreductase n=1 Tax=Pseudonocardia adelaidensis TaxID=648754 RepID=A0ABP9NA68_9PSEU
MDDFDVVVAGGGAAGLNAALVLARARRRVAVIDAGDPRNAPAAHMQGFLSRDGMAPARLLEEGRAEVAGYGAEIVAERAERIEAGFAVHLASGRTLHARRVLVATGLRDELPDVPGLRERWARDVLHCPYCHGYEVRDRPLGILGTPHLGLLLPQWSADVVFFPHRTELSADERERLLARGVHIADGEVAGLVVDGDALRGVELADGRVVPREVLFVGPRFVPRDDLLAGLGCATGEDGWVRTDPTGRTSVPGVWAAGNVVDPRAQAVTAAGMGSAAAIALNADLVEEDVRRAVAAHRQVAGTLGAPASAG